MKNTFKRIKDLISSQKDLTSLGIVDIVSSAIGAVFWFYIASILGAEQYGKISYFLAIAGIASTVSLLGGPSTLTVYTAKNAKIQSTVYLITICSGIVSSIVLFFMSFSFNDILFSLRINIFVHLFNKIVYFLFSIGPNDSILFRILHQVV